MSSFLHSIRWRIQVWHGVILLVAIGAFCVTAYHFAWDHQMRRLDRELQDSERLLIRTLMDYGQKTGAPPVPPEKLAEALRARQITLPPAVAAQFTGATYFTLRDADGSVLLQSDNTPDDIRPLPVPAAGFAEDFRSIGKRRESLRASSRGFSSVFGRDITREIADMHRFGLILAASGLGVWFFGLLGGWWLAGRAIKPVHTISRTATRIADGNLDERIDTTGGDSELDQLVRVLNQTFSRLQASFERERRFSSDASHELRTPVSVLIAETQRILRRERTPAEYHEALQTCQNNAERMRGLIEALLTLSRQEAADNCAAHQPCDLADILRDTIGQLQPLAIARDVRLFADLTNAPLRGDAPALGILFANLIRNAIQHRPADARDGRVDITCRREGDRVLITVADNGPGIAAEDLPHVFERFYRADKARTGGTGHTGLGLAIAKTIAQNHGGTITVQSRPAEGVIFTVDLPTTR